MRRPHGHTQRLIRRVLGPEGLMDLTVIRTRVEEQLLEDAQTCCAVVLSVVPNLGAPFEVTGQGVGLVDAVYQALMGRYAEAHPSLRSLSFDTFDVRAACHDAGCAGAAEVILAVRNEAGRVFEFEAVGRSTLGAAVAAMTGLICYFVNAERAFLRLHEALADAFRRHRPDLVEQFRNQLVELVFDGAEYTAVVPGRPALQPSWPSAPSPAQASPPAADDSADHSWC